MDEAPQASDACGKEVQPPRARRKRRHEHDVEFALIALVCMTYFWSGDYRVGYCLCCLETPPQFVWFGSLLLPV